MFGLSGKGWDGMFSHLCDDLSCPGLHAEEANRNLSIRMK